MRSLAKALGILLLIGALAGCSPKVKEGQNAEDLATDQQLPQYKLQQVTHLHYESGILRFKVIFDRGSFFSGTDELHVENSSFVYYDSYGSILSRGRSKTATLFKNKAQLIAEEDVVVVSEVNGGVLTTDYLEWHGDKNQFKTESFVTITRKNGDILQGIGMITDVALRYVQVKKDVKGKIKVE
jgi:LPS export ABC transporter protein LptC